MENEDYNETEMIIAVALLIGHLFWLALTVMEMR